MEADELLVFAIRVLAESRKQLDEYLDLLRSLEQSDTRRVRDAMKSIDQLVSAIRVYQMPVCMSQPDAKKYLSEKPLK